MYQDDWLFRPIQQLADALARRATGESPEQVHLDAAVRGAVGLDLTTLDALPTAVLCGLALPDDPQSIDRVRLIARLLEASADDSLEGEHRREKARQIAAYIDALPPTAARV